MRNKCARSLASRADHQGAPEDLDEGGNPLHLYDTTSGAESQAARYQKSELLALADACLEEHNTAWATFIATGDDAAYIAAMAAKQDWEQLLAQVGGDDD